MRSGWREWLSQAGVWLTLAALAAAGFGLGFQGWKHFYLDIDFLADMENAIALAEHGQIPVRGPLLGLGSYCPPGLSWVLAPGVLLSSDVRLYQLPGLLVIYAGTLLGIFLLARHFWGPACGLLAAGLFAFSERGQAMAYSLWPRYTLPFFCVWTAYWACLWVGRRQPRYLAYALLIWGLGLFMLPETAPALLFLPVLWLIYRPPVGVRSLAAAGLVLFLIWFPYFRYEWGRGFLDVRSIIGRVNLLPPDYQSVWCDPRLAPRLLGSKPAPPVSPAAPGRPDDDHDEAPVRGRQFFLRRIESALTWVGQKGGLVVQAFNRDAALPGAGALVFLLTAAGMGLLGLRRPAPAQPLAPEKSHTGRLLSILAVGLIVLSLTANEIVLARLFGSGHALGRARTTTVRVVQVILVLGGLVLLLRRPLTAAITRISAGTPDARPLVVALLIPWLILIVLVEPGREDRMWWLWSLQVIVLAAAATVIPRRLGAPRPLAAALAVLLVVLTFGYNSASAHWEDWRYWGWSGSDSEELDVVDQVAGQVRAAGRDRAAIGYRISFTGGEASQFILDPRYKLGANWDFLFRRLRRIANEDQCPEGVSPQDEYRVVEVRTLEDNEAYPTSVEEGRSYFPVPIPEGFEEVGRSWAGTYQVLRRRAASANPPANGP